MQPPDFTGESQIQHVKLRCWHRSGGSIPFPRRTHYFSLCLRWSKARPFHRGNKNRLKIRGAGWSGAQTSSPQLCLLSLGRFQKAKAWVACSSHWAGMPIFILIGRKSPLTVPPTRDSCWASPSHLHHPFALQRASCITEKRKPWRDLSLPVSLSCYYL